MPPKIPIESAFVSFSFTLPPPATEMCFASAPVTAAFSAMMRRFASPPVRFRLSASSSEKTRFAQSFSQSACQSAPERFSSVFPSKQESSSSLSALKPRSFSRKAFASDQVSSCACSFSSFAAISIVRRSSSVSVSALLLLSSFVSSSSAARTKVSPTPVPPMVVTSMARTRSIARNCRCFFFILLPPSYDFFHYLTVLKNIILFFLLTRNPLESRKKCPAQAARQDTFGLFVFCLRVQFYDIRKTENHGFSLSFTYLQTAAVLFCCSHAG